jgi:hypothetical protein
LDSRLNYLDDPVGVVLELDKEVGKFETDETGYYSFYLPNRDQELVKLNSDWGQEIDAAIRDHAEHWERLAANERAFEGIHDQATEEKPAIVIPIVRRDCNQIIAWLANTSLRPRPITSFDPYANAEYDVPVATQMGQGLIKVNAEKIAATIEQGFEFKSRERLGIEQLFTDILTDMVSGMTPTFVKIVHEYRARKVKLPKFKKSEGKPWNVEIDGTAEFEVAGEEPTRFAHVGPWNLITPAGVGLDEDLQKIDWCAENTPWSTTKLRAKLQSWGERALVLPEEWDALLLQTSEIITAQQRENKQLIDKRIPSVPRGYHDVKELHFRLAVRYKGVDPVTGKTVEQIRIVNACGAYHFGARKFLAIWELPFNHQKRPYVSFVQRKRPRKMTGTSTAEDVMPFQRFITEILNINLKNAAIANATPIVADPDSDGFDWLANNELDSASLIPANPEDVKAINFGREHRSMMNEITWLNNESRSTSNVSVYEQGGSIPGRTSPNTTSQILQAGMQQPLMVLRDFSVQWGKAVRLWLETYRQFEPFGEMIPIRNPETKAIINVAFMLPADEVMDNFRIALTAADEELAKENEFEQLAMLANMLDSDAAAMAQILQPYAQTGIPESIAPIFRLFIDRKQKIVEAMLERTRKDAKNFVITPELLDAVDMEREMVRQQQMMAQAAAAAAAQGGMNGDPMGPGGPGVQAAGQAPQGAGDGGVAPDGLGQPSIESALLEMGAGASEPSMEAPIE